MPRSVIATKNLRSHGPARVDKQSFGTKIMAIAQSSVEIASLKKKKKKKKEEDEQFGNFADPQISTFATDSSNLDGRVGFRTREYKDQEPIKAVSLYFRRVIRASVCITLY